MPGVKKYGRRYFGRTELGFSELETISDASKIEGKLCNLAQITLKNILSVQTLSQSIADDLQTVENYFS